MTTQIKYLLFKGLAKKEEILFKSFLNLAKNDLDYQVVVLKSSQVLVDDPDIVIVDEAYDFSDQELSLKTLPTVMVGNDHRNDQDCYVTRPVQWSEFKHAIINLQIGVEVDENHVERILPDAVRMVIADADASSDEGFIANSDKPEKPFSDEGDYEFELDKLSANYHSFTNSDYIKVVDDVRQFHENSEAYPDEAVILITDDESASANSVLVLETNTMDVWDLTRSDFSSSQIIDQAALAGVLEEPPAEEVVLEQRAGFEIYRDDEFWLEDAEIIADNRTLMFIKSQREMVYSEYDPGNWPQLIQRGALSKAPLDDEWRPQSNLTAYPISSLLWVHSLVNATSELDTPFDDDVKYQLESWPQFNLLELDNVLLKLCTMLFVRPESVAGLARKSGYGRSTIRGLMNACLQLGYLKLPEEITGEKMVAANTADEGMLGKIKDVFR